MTYFRRFLLDTAGAVTVDWVVLSAGLIGVGLAANGAVQTPQGRTAHEIALMMDASEISFASRHSGRSPREVAQGIQLRHFDETFKTTRMDTLLNAFSDQRLRNQYRIWRNRLADPDYGNPDRAADHVALLTIAMDARGLTPKP
ncbi:MAG: hypothetical protein AAF366_18755 [Pseudomonadota bacterium]